LEKNIRPFIRTELQILELTFPDSTFFENVHIIVPAVKSTTPLIWDPTTVAIMKHMAQGHGRDSLYEISRALKIPYDRVHHHAKKILQSNAIGKILAQQGLVKFGLVNTTTSLKLKTQEATKRVLNLARNAKRVSAVALCAENNILILTTTASQQEFLQTISSCTYGIHEHIQDVHHTFWTETILNNRYPLEELLNRTHHLKKI
jgi:hypothetical protein